MKKPYISKKGKFLVAATYPLHYAGYAKPISKSLESLEEFEAKGHTILTNGHADKEGKFENIGQLKNFKLEKKEIKGKEEGELYSDEILLHKTSVGKLKPGAYGLSPDFLYSGASFSDTEDADAYTLEVEKLEFTTVALVDCPRHQTKDIDLNNLKQDIVRSMYDSSGTGFDRVSDFPVVIVGNSAIALQDSVSCDILDINDTKYPKEEFEKTLIENVTAKIMALLGSKNTHNNVEDIDMNKEELEKILDEKLTKLFDDKIGIALKDSADGLATEVNTVFEKLQSHLASLTTSASATAETEPKEPVDPVKTAEELLEENAKLKAELAEQSYLMQTMQKPEAKTETPEPAVTAGSDSADTDFLKDLLTK